MKKARLYKHKRLHPSLGLSPEMRETLVSDAHYAYISQNSFVSFTRNRFGIVVVRLDFDLIDWRVMITENVLNRVRRFYVDFHTHTIHRFRAKNLADVKLLNKQRL